MASVPKSLDETFDVAVCGAGPAGLATALAATRLGLSVAAIGPRAGSDDGRTAALFLSSVAFLKNIGCWQSLGEAAEPLEAIRLIDATGALFRAPEVMFRAEEIGLDAFGYNVPNSALTAALESALEGRARRLFSPAASCDLSSEPVLTLSSGDVIRAKLIGAADGRQSLVRTAAGIDVKTWRYEQAAVVTTFRHSRPHKRMSSEFHRKAGPLTVVPGPGDTSSLVWVETPDNAKRLIELDEAQFAVELETHLCGLLGKLKAFAPRRLYPLTGQTALKFAQNRTALIGEAGHVIPPIGAQGLNLSFRDAATFAEVARDAKDQSGDAGSAQAIERFQSRRSQDIASRVWTVDLLNRSLLSEHTPVHLARGFGLFSLSAIGPLRRLLMREGVSPSFSTPKLMQSPDAPGKVAQQALDQRPPPQA